MSSAPSPEALSAGRDLRFEALQEFMGLAASYSLSAREAAWRGDQATLGTHLKQLRLVLLEALKTWKELEG